MHQHLEIKLQEEFSTFMKQNHVKGERNIYRRWGCQCDSGWYTIIQECCQLITERYETAGIPIDFEPTQIKEKLGTLRFYYRYPDSPCRIAAFDFLGDGTSLRFEPGNKDDDEEKKKLRQDIYRIVRDAEEKTKTTCEKCGATTGMLRHLRDDRGFVRVQTLCDTCHQKRIQSVERR